MGCQHCCEIICVWNLNIYNSNRNSSYCARNKENTFTVLPTLSTSSWFKILEKTSFYVRGLCNDSVVKTIDKSKNRRINIYTRNPKLEKLACEFIYGSSIHMGRSWLSGKFSQLWQASTQFQSHLHFKQLSVFSFLQISFLKCGFNWFLQ